MRPLVGLGLVLVLLWSIHLVATFRHGLVLPDAARSAVGASAETVWSRLYAQFSAPFFHDNLFHIAYNSVLFGIGIPVAINAFGGRVLPVAYLASPIAGVLVDALIILPLAKSGNAVAIAAAPSRLVGASVVAFALLGMALLASSPRGGGWTAAIGLAVVAYEATLAFTGVTRPFVWAYHLSGFGLGALATLVLRRAP